MKINPWWTKSLSLVIALASIACSKDYEIETVDTGLQTETENSSNEQNQTSNENGDDAQSGQLPEEYENNDFPNNGANDGDIASPLIDGVDGNDQTGDDSSDGSNGSDGSNSGSNGSGSDQNSGNDGQDGNDGSNGSDGNNGSDGTNSGSDGSGRDGRDGADGRNGVDGCGLVARTMNVSLDRMSSEELEAIDRNSLPYISTRHNEVGLLRAGYGNRMEAGIRVVHDAMVVFDITVPYLPPKAAIDSVSELGLTLDITRIGIDRRARTEMICFNDLHICNGTLFEASSWLENINEDYFEAQGRPVSTLFNDVLHSNELASSSSYSIYGLTDTFYFIDLLEGTEVEPLDVLYGSADENSQIKNKTIRFIVADDTYVDPAHSELVFNYVEDTCKTTELTRPSSRNGEQNGDKSPQ